MSVYPVNRQPSYTASSSDAPSCSTNAEQIITLGCLGKSEAARMMKNLGMEGESARRRD